MLTAMQLVTQVTVKANEHGRDMTTEAWLEACAALEVWFREAREGARRELAEKVARKRDAS